MIHSLISLHLLHNTITVMIGAALLGIAAGTLGTFLLLRKKALVSDALGHATLPGVGIGFLFSYALGQTSHTLPYLLIGALISSYLGLLVIQKITAWTRLTEDAAIGATLSVFFGLGIVLLSYIQTLTTGGQAGLKAFIFGQAAAMSTTEIGYIAGLCFLSIILFILFFKELRGLAFDPQFGRVQGWPIKRVEALLMVLVALVTVFGLRVVGLVLMVALLIIPAAAARFWTERLNIMVMLAAFFGGLSGYGGALVSAAFPQVPTGAAIVLMAGSLFIISVVLAPCRGVLFRT